LGLRGEWRKLHNEELSDLYCSPNIVWVIKSRIRWVGHVARMEQRIGTHRILAGKPKGMVSTATAFRCWLVHINCTHSPLVQLLSLQVPLMTTTRKKT